MNRNTTVFVKDDNGTITHVVRHVGRQQGEVYQTLRRLHSPYLPTIFCVEEDEAGWSVEYEYIEGMSLKDVSGLDDDELLRVALDVTRALCCIHASEPAIVHRDVKPANIVHRSQGGYVLIDFDTARIFRLGADCDTSLGGTAGYAPPEQFGFMQSDNRSDIYSLGATLYELKTGRPYRAGDVCGGRLGRIIRKCTAFSPADRYRDVQALYKALRRIQRGGFRRMLLPAACALLGAAIGISVGLAMRSDSKQINDTKQFPVSASEDKNVCVCEPDIRYFALEADKGGLVELQNGAPVQLKLSASVPILNTDQCTAQEHDRPQAIGVQLRRCTLGGRAEVSEDGSITIYEEGVYEIDGIIAFGEECYGPIITTIIAAQDLRAYTECRCVFDVGAVDYIKPTYGLPANGDPVQIDLKFKDPVIDSRLCKSPVHATLLFMPAGWLHAPEGSDVRVDENNILSTTTPGAYQLDIPMWFRLREEDHFHYDIYIEK